MASFNDQQWDNVVFNKKGVRKTGQSQKQHINSQMRAGNVTATKKMGNMNNSSLKASGRVGGEQNMCKLETDNESTKHAKVSRELSKAIAQARQAKSMTQKQFELQIPLPETIPESCHEKGAHRTLHSKLHSTANQRMELPLQDGRYTRYIHLSAGTKCHVT